MFPPDDDQSDLDGRDGITLKELCDASGESARTVRFYLRNGLIEGASSFGPGARYPASNVLRLRLIRRLQGDGLPLARIREMLDQTPEDALQTVLDGPPAAPSVQESLGFPPPRARHHAPSFDKGGRSSARSQWERVVLEPGVELHIRRPLAIPANRRARRVIELYPTLVKE